MTQDHPEQDVVAAPTSRTPRTLHALAAAGLLAAGVLWLLHYPLRPDCPPNYVHFDLGIPVVISVLCGIAGGYHAWRVRSPSRLGVVAAVFVVVALVVGALGGALVVGDLTGSANDCWTF